MSRKVHYWGALVCAVPVLIIIATGILLLLKKESSWIQPPTVKVENKGVVIGFEEVLEAAKTAKGTEINGWDDIDRMDVRPGKGIVKVQSKSRWEVQVDLSSGEVLQVAFRRSDWIESIHDGTFFHDHAKLLVWLPSSIILLILWITGIYLFAIPLWKKRSRKKKPNDMRAIA